MNCFCCLTKFKLFCHYHPQVEFPKSGSLKPDMLEKIKKSLAGPAVTPLNRAENFEYTTDFHETDLNPNPKGGSNSRFYEFMGFIKESDYSGDFENLIN